MRYVPSQSKIWYKKFSLTSNKFNLTNNEFNTNIYIYNIIFQQSNQRRTISSNRSEGRLNWLITVTMDIKRSLNCFLDPQLPPIGPSLLKIICSSASKRGRLSYLPSIWADYLHNLKVAQNGYMEKWCFFFRRWSRNLEMDTWRSGCFWFYCIQNFRA